MRSLTMTRRFTLALLALGTAACAVRFGSPTAGPAASTSAPTPGLPTATAEHATAASASPTPEAPATPAPSPVAKVQVTATGGNLTLRRGPATAYNVLIYMLNGQAAQAVARKQAADWLLVQDPAGGGKTAWVTAASRYSVVDGGAQAVQALPIESVDSAVPAYIRNCTFHPMRIFPADYVLTEQLYPPDNRRAFSPGAYEAYDQSVEGKPKVMSEELREGETIDISRDGLNNSCACPA